MLNFLRHFKSRRRSVDEELAEYGLTRDDLQDVDLAFSISADDIALADLQKIGEGTAVDIRNDESNFTAMEFFSVSSNAITIISFLISLERWVSARTPLECDGQKVPLNDAIPFYLNKILANVKRKSE